MWLSKVLLASLLATPGLAQLDVDELFQVDWNENEYGGCEWVGKDVMNTLVQEAFTLAEAGVQLIEDFRAAEQAIQDDPDADPPLEAARLFEGYWKDTTLEEEELIYVNFKKVRDWLKEGGTNDGHIDPNNKPLLFCHSDWAKRTTIQDFIYDLDGELTEKEDGMFMKIYENDVVMEGVRDHAARVGKSPDELYPYYNSDYNYYIWDDKYADSPWEWFCDGNKGDEARVYWPEGRGAMTLCAQSFGTTIQDRFNWDKSFNELHFRTPDPHAWEEISSSQNPWETFQMLAALRPTVGNFFHELFHLVLGEAASLPDVGEFYKLQFLLRADPEQAVKNPESYAMAAISYDLTMYHEPNGDGNRPEWYLGFTTQG